METLPNDGHLMPFSPYQPEKERVKHYHARRRNMALEQYKVLLCTLRIQKGNLRPLYDALTDAEVYVHWYTGEPLESFLHSFALKVDVGTPLEEYADDHPLNLAPTEYTYLSAWDRFFEIAGAFLEPNGEYLLAGSEGTRVGWRTADGKAEPLKALIVWVPVSAPDQVAESFTESTVGLAKAERAEDLGAGESCAA